MYCAFEINMKGKFNSVKPICLMFVKTITLYDKFKKEQDPNLAASALISLNLNKFDDIGVDSMK